MGSGSERALTQLVRRHEQSTFNLVYRILMDQEEAEEVAQDAFLQSFKELHGLQDWSKYKSWLLTIAYRKAIDKVRLKKRITTELNNLDTQQGKFLNPPDIVEKMQQIRLKQELELLMDKLSELDRGLITLFYLEEFNIPAVADATGLTESNVKIRLMRARIFLKKELEKRHLTKEDLY
ncbi:MAG: RNA polymerase sigma factor [Saprospiraceae bacterium]